MGKAMTLIGLIVGTIFFFGLGILWVFFQDIAWEIHKKQKKSAGLRKLHRTEEWERTTRIAGIGFLIATIFFCILTITVFVNPY